MKNYKELAFDAFYGRDFKNSLYYFSLALENAPNDKELRIGAILADLALEKEEEAILLFEYYTSSSFRENIENEKILEDIIESLENGPHKLFSLFEQELLDEKLEAQNGILYSDFIEAVKERGSFSLAFEDIMFSTKVIITNKDDFLEFLDMRSEEHTSELQSH